jgi:hypothetical protein
MMMKILKKIPNANTKLEFFDGILKKNLFISLSNFGKDFNFCLYVGPVSVAGYFAIPKFHVNE